MLKFIKVLKPKKKERVSEHTQKEINNKTKELLIKANDFLKKLREQGL